LSDAFQKLTIVVLGKTFLIVFEGLQFQWENKLTVKREMGENVDI
jgi:hypothetical protein